MYVQTSIRNAEAAPRLGQPTTKPYKPPYDKGGAAIEEKDGPKLLTILAGPSPFQAYIRQAMARPGATPPKDFLRIVSSVGSQVPAASQHLFRSSDGSLVAGTVDRWTRTIYMIQAPGLRDETRLEYALHECVHLFADPVAPVAGSCPRVCLGTFQRTYGVGFGEGATQAITEAIMNAQGIERYYRARPYEVFTPPVRRLIEIFSADLLGRAYFLGGTADFTKAMLSRWGSDWLRVKEYTSAKCTGKALKEIERLETEYFKRLRTPGPKGDYPSPLRVSKMA